MTSKYKIIYTPEAQDDLNQIIENILGIAWLRSAEKWALKITNKIESVSVFPEGNPTYEYDQKYRTIRVGKYRVIYEIYKKERIIAILRIMYARRNLANIILKPKILVSI